MNAALPLATTPPVILEDEMKRSYLDYAMSVIVSRALPDVRDGLKPVHRRILYAMKEGGYDYNKPYRKSARIVGDVMGKYHPHGDSAIYDAMVRMAQDFSMRLPLIDGQGNFGSMDGDPPAAMRYTEARLAEAATYLLNDIDHETVTFGPNYDDSTVEPLVLPAEFPNLLVNGASGIAVGMATNIPTHNLGEVIDGVLALLDNPATTIDELIKIIPGPDFPTGGIIMGRQGSMDAARTGRGSVIMRGKCSIESMKGDREQIIITEMPYQVNKARLVEQIADLVREKTIEGISDLRDESDRDGVRVVIEIKRDGSADIVLNQLYKMTPLQTSFGVNSLALHGGRPQVMNLRDMLVAFIDFRRDVVTKRTSYLLRQARARGHVLLGLAVAVQNIDEVIKIIRASADPTIAREALMAKTWKVADIAPYLERIDQKTGTAGSYTLSEVQAKAILDLRLHRLTGLEREKIMADLKEVLGEINDYLDILQSPSRLTKVVRTELVAFREKFATPRRTQFEENMVETNIEDLIQREDMVITITGSGYIKRTALDTYRAQRRGGKGRAGMNTKEDDYVGRVFVANTHTPVLFFTSIGKVFELKVYKLPEGNPQAKGKAMVNLLPLIPGETISTVMPLPDDQAKWPSMSVMFATSKGDVRRNSLTDFLNIKANGKIAMKLEHDEKLIAVEPCAEDSDVLLFTRLGKCIRFAADDVRQFQSRSSTGVRGIKLAEKDEVMGMSILGHVEASAEEREAYIRQANAARRKDDERDDDAPASTITLTPKRFAEMAAAEEFLLSVTERGFGKRSSAYEYRQTGRGGSGIANIEVTAKNGPVVGTFPVKDTDQVVLVTTGGTLIRMPVQGIRLAGRRTQGVTLVRVEGDEKVVSAARLSDDETNDTPADLLS